MFLGELMQECSSRIGTMAAEYLDIKHDHGVKVDRCIQPAPLTVYLDSGLVDCDPPMSPLPDRLMRAIDAEQAENGGCFSKR